jgi:hypothetical protein
MLRPRLEKPDAMLGHAARPVARRPRDAEQSVQLAGRNEFRAGRRRRAGRRLRKAGRARCMERHIAFDLLHELVNVAVQHGDRTKASEQFQRLGRILRAPAPFGGNGPQGNMREDDERRRCALYPSDRPPQPGELLGPEIAHAARLQVEDVVEADEMRAAVIEGIPALALGKLAIAVEIGLAGAFVDGRERTYSSVPPREFVPPSGDGKETSHRPLLFPAIAENPAAARRELCCNRIWCDHARSFRRAHQAFELGALVIRQ